MLHKKNFGDTKSFKNSSSESKSSAQKWTSIDLEIQNQRLCHLPKFDFKSESKRTLN